MTRSYSPGSFFAQMSATLFGVAAACRSTQLKATLRRPPPNHEKSTSSRSTSSVDSGGWNHVSRCFASAAQKASGSSRLRWYRAR